MKRFLCSVFLVLALLCSAVMPAYAVDAMPTTELLDDGSTVIYYDDGSTLTISPVYGIENNNNARVSTIKVPGNKDVVYKDNSGNIEWKYTLSATFSVVSGVSSTCTSASYTKTIYDDSWSFSNGSATKSGNTAYGKGRFTQNILFGTTKNYDVDIHITCDKYGNIS